MWYATLQNLIKIPVILLGLVMVPVMWFYRRTPIKDVPKVLLPWCNPEDWFGGYRQFPVQYNCVPPNLYGGKRGFWEFFKYHAFRNGGDGLRNYEWHNCKYVHEDMVLVYKNDNGYRIQQGKYGSIGRYWFNKRYYTKYGFRCTPRDVKEGYDPKSFRWNFGAAPAWSFRKVDWL